MPRKTTSRDKKPEPGKASPKRLPKVNVVFVSLYNALGDVPCLRGDSLCRFDEEAVGELRKIVKAARAKVVVINPHTEAGSWKRYGKGPSEEDSARYRELEEKLGVPGCVLGETPCMYRPAADGSRCERRKPFTNADLVEHCLYNFKELFSAKVANFLVLDQVTYDYSGRLKGHVVNAPALRCCSTDFPNSVTGLALAESIRILGGRMPKGSEGWRLHDVHVDFPTALARRKEEWEEEREKKSPTTLDGVVRKIVEDAVRRQADSFAPGSGPGGMLPPCLRQVQRG